MQTRTVDHTVTQLRSTTQTYTDTHTLLVWNISLWLIDLWPTKRMMAGIKGEQRNTWVDQVTGTAPHILEKLITYPHELGWACKPSGLSVRGAEGAQIQYKCTESYFIYKDRQPQATRLFVSFVCNESSTLHLQSFLSHFLCMGLNHGSWTAGVYAIHLHFFFIFSIPHTHIVMTF